MAIAIVTDSTAYISEEVRQEHKSSIQRSNNLVHFQQVRSRLSVKSMNYLTNLRESMMLLFRFIFHQELVERSKV